jgi:hypothetical protein
MSESSESTERGRSKTPKERLFGGYRSKVPGKNFGTIVRALWPDKPALNLSQRLGCTERGAQLYIDGERKVTAHAVSIIVQEMLD